MLNLTGWPCVSGRERTTLGSVCTKEDLVFPGTVKVSVLGAPSRDVVSPARVVCEEDVQLVVRIASTVVPIKRSFFI